MTSISEQDNRRRALAQLLKHKRARLRPDQFNIRGNRRRRVSGLSREEVAVAAGISVTWYTWMEQARSVRPSLAVLEGLSRALRLNDLEKKHMFALALPELDSVEGGIPSKELTPELQGFIDALAPNPVYAVNACWDVLGWNQQAVDLFGEFVGDDKTNILTRLFLDEQWRTLFVDWAKVAESSVSQFRASIGVNADIPKIKTIVDQLQAKSDAFTECWAQYHVSRAQSWTKKLNLNSHGLVTLNYQSLRIESTPDIRLTVYTPASEADKKRLRQYFGDQQ